MSTNNLSGVKDTLFIPLMARIEISKKFPEYFYDEKALNIEKFVPTNIITQKSSEYSMMASASRAKVMDSAVISFLQHQNEKTNVICIGCGLETMAFRLKEHSNSAHFYEIDFPSVIKKRKAVLGTLDNETLIEGNANELDFSKLFDCNLPTIFVIAGVFQYFKEHEVLSLISRLRQNFNLAHILFDATDEYGIKYAAKYVKKTGNKDAMMYFYINDPKEFAKKTNTTLVFVSGFYQKIDSALRKKLKFYTRIATKIVDKKMRAMILQYKL